jgi:hypothetical protein
MAGIINRPVKKINMIEGNTIAIRHFDLDCMPKPSCSRAIGLGLFRVASNCELGDHMP